MATGAEEWRAVVGYEGFYEVSNFGNVRNMRGDVLQPIKNRAGYYRLNLCKNGVRRAIYLHRIVAEAFCDNTRGMPFVNHKDENPENNTADNLEWCTGRYNCNYGGRNARVSAHRTNKGSRPVIAVDAATGEVVFAFPSLREAGRQGHAAGMVWAAIHQSRQTHGGVKRTYHGCVWRYADASLRS